MSSLPSAPVAFVYGVFKEQTSVCRSRHSALTAQVSGVQGFARRDGILERKATLARRMAAWFAMINGYDTRFDVFKENDRNSNFAEGHQRESNWGYFFELTCTGRWEPRTCLFTSFH